jgi:hypothetical protein
LYSVSDGSYNVVPFAYLGIAKDVAGFIEAHDIALKNYDFDTIVAGHLTRLGTRADVEVQQEFVLDLERAAARANQNVSFMDIASQVGLMTFGSFSLNILML